MMIAWFSCGVTSAVACKIALSLYNKSFGYDLLVSGNFM